LSFFESIPALCFAGLAPERDPMKRKAKRKAAHRKSAGRKAAPKRVQTISAGYSAITPYLAI